MTPGTWFGQTAAHCLDGSFTTNSGKEATCCNDPDPGTWAYDPSLDDWSDITPASEPTPRFDPAMAHIEGTNTSIILGGNLIDIGSGGANGDSIEHVGPRPQSGRPFWRARRSSPRVTALVVDGGMPLGSTIRARVAP